MVLIISNHSFFWGGERGVGGVWQCFGLWHYLRDHGEEMKKRHKKPTSALQEVVKELEDGSTTKVNFSKKVLGPVDAGHGNSQEDKKGNK